jgi:hypothetical protein
VIVTTTVVLVGLVAAMAAIAEKGWHPNVSTTAAQPIRAATFTSPCIVDGETTVVDLLIGSC